MKPFFSQKADSIPLAGWMATELTPVDKFGDWWAKRDDTAGFIDHQYPSGSKWRQYLEMAKTAPDATMIVGCTSTYSAMQIYVAAAAKVHKVPSIIYIPTRKVPTDATAYAIAMGAEIHNVPAPSWPSRCRADARTHAQSLDKFVRWNPTLALRDAAFQCQNLPTKVKRVVVPTGSGLTASGVLAGLAIMGRKITVVAVVVSELAQEDAILRNARKLTDATLPSFEMIRADGKYSDWVAARLPDGTPLDPYYSAKALPFVHKGDCFWLPGIRAWPAFPEACRELLLAEM